MKNARNSNMHQNTRGHWADRLRNNPPSKDDLPGIQGRLQYLLQTATQKTGQINGMTALKTREQLKLQDKLKNMRPGLSETEKKKTLKKSKTEIENHLRWIIRELDTKKMELKKVCHEVSSIEQRLRKNRS